MTYILSLINLIAASSLSILGTTLVTSAFMADLILILGELFMFESNPYIGIFAYLIFPGLAVLGLLLIPAGIYLKARKYKNAGWPAAISIVLERKRVNRMHVLQMVFGLTMMNLVIFGILGYRGFHYTESKEFCGMLCHKVMLPEYTTYRRSPHSEISCVECHIGAGAGWFVKSKLSGTRQVLAVTFDSFSRPIKTPIHNLRPAREVCEVCHRPEIFHGNLFKVLQHFEPDETNTRTYTILNMRVGSGGEHGREANGIHWHVSKQQQIRYYATDPKRENIVWVEITNLVGSRRIWRRPDGEADRKEIDPESLRLMDCVDCHNRPTHIFLSPSAALDEWMAQGFIDPSIPWIRKVSEEVLTRKYLSREEARQGIAKLPEIYQQGFPDKWVKYQEKVKSAVPILQEIHRLFVHPEMKIEWNTYPSLLGHPTPQTAGCFRCHDGVLRDEQGIPITTKCESCHYVLANKELDPAILKILEDR